MAVELPPVIATFIGNITDLKAKLGEASEEMTAAATLTKAQAKEIEVAVDKEVATMAAAAKAAGTEFDATAAKAELMATRTEEATARSSSSFTKMAGFGKVALLGTAALAIGVGTVSVNMAMDFQQSMTLLQSAAGELPSNMKTVSNGILDLATKTGTSTQQLAEGMYTIEKAGQRGADGLLILKAAAEGAKAENVDLGTATNALTSIMMSYHMSASQATSAENMLVAGSGLAKTSMQEYAGSLAAVLPVASAAGIGFDQVGGAIATLTQHGTSAQEATQELANTIRGLQAPNQVAVKAMQQLGINVTDLTSNLGTRGLTGTISLITDAIGKSLGPAGLVVVDTFKKSQSAASDLQTMLGKMPKNLADLSSSYLAGNTSVKDYQKSVKDMGGQGAAMGLQFLALAKSSQGFNDLIKSGSPQAQTFAGTLNKVMGGATGMNTALMLGGENMAYFQKATEEVGAAGKKTGSDVSSWALTQKNLSVQLAQAREQVQVMAIKIGTFLIPYVSKAIHLIGEWATWLGKHKVILEVVAGVIGGILAVVIAAYIVSMISAAVATLAATWEILAIIAAVTALALGFAYAYKHSKTFHDVINDIGKVAMWLWKNVLKPFGEFFITDWKIQVGIAIDVIKFFIGIPGDIMKAWGAVTGFFSQLWSDVVNGLEGAASWIAGLPRRFYDYVVSQGGLVGIGKKLGTDLYNGLMSVTGTILGFFADLPGKMLGLLTTAGTWLVGVGSDILSGLGSGISTAWDNEVAFWEALPGRILAFFSAAPGWLANAGQNIINGLWNGIKWAWAMGVAFFTSLPQIIINGIGDTLGSLYNVGVHLIEGLWNGIKSMGNWLKNKIEGFLGGFLGGIGSFLGIGSPSKVFADKIGQWIPAGIAVGIESGADPLMNSTKQVTLSAIAAGQSATVNPGPGAATASSAGNSTGALTVIFQGTVMATRAEIFEAVQAAYLEHGATNSQTYQSFGR